MAPGVGSDELQSVRETAGRLRGQPMIGRIADRHERGDRRKRIVEPGRRIGGNEGATSEIGVLQRRQRIGQRIERGLAGRSEIHRQSVRRIDHGLPVQLYLHWKIDPARAKVTNFGSIVVRENMLNAEVPLNGLRALLIRNITLRQKASFTRTQWTDGSIGKNSASGE